LREMERGQTVRALLRIIERTHDTTCVRALISTTTTSWRGAS
jgi:hypothetical protein